MSHKIDQAVDRVNSEVDKAMGVLDKAIGRVEANAISAVLWGAFALSAIVVLLPIPRDFLWSAVFALGTGVLMWFNPKLLSSSEAKDALKLSLYALVVSTVVAFVFVKANFVSVLYLFALGFVVYARYKKLVLAASPEQGDGEQHDPAAE